MRHIVIVGGSYAGLEALDLLGRRNKVRITLVDRHPYHFMQTEGYDLIAGRVAFDETIVGLRSLCASYGPHVSFLHAAAQSLEPERRRLRCDNGAVVEYDYLLVAAGAVTRFFESVSGLRSRSHGVKSLRAAFKLRQFFEAELYQRLESAAQARRHYSILVGGAGLSGVEIAAEMQAFFNRYYRSNALACGRLKIHLVGSSPELLPGMAPAMAKTATRRLEALGVQLHCGSKIVRVEEESALLENGREIPFDFMIFAGGIIAAPFVSALALPQNERGQLRVDGTMRVRGSDRILAAGDAAELTDERGRAIAPTAQSAKQSGRAAARTILALLDERTPPVSAIRIRGMAVALGGRYAVIDIGGVRLSGLWAYGMKKAIEKSHKWPLKRRARRGARLLGSCRELSG